jgi:hypothetical protein
MPREPGGDRRVLWLRGIYLMPSAIETIVAVYVEHKNRLALDDMLRHRQRLLTDLKSRSGFDVSLPIQNVSEDIAAIEAGLIQLRGEVPAIAPRVDWSRG